jgi:ferredoxin-NADP reductase
LTEPLKEDRRTGAERRRPFETYDLVVEAADLITPRNKHLRFRLPKGKELHFEAGQFVQMFIPDNGKTRRTSYSIASSPQHNDYFELCVTLVDGGKSSTFLHLICPSNSETAHSRVFSKWEQDSV